MRGDDTRRDAALWRRSRTADMTAEEVEAERYLDLAGFADGRLDPDDSEQVAERLAGDPVAAGDVAAPRAPAAGAERGGGRDDPADRMAPSAGAGHPAAFLCGT